MTPAATDDARVGRRDRHCLDHEARQPDAGIPTDRPARVLPFVAQLARISPPRSILAAVLAMGLGLGLAGHRLLIVQANAGAIEDDRPSAGPQPLGPQSGPRRPAVAFRDGGGVFAVGVDGGRGGVASSVDPAIVALVVDAAMTGRVRLPPAPGRTASGARRLTRVSPAGVTPMPVTPQATRVRDGQPRFSWTATAGANHYVVTITDSAGNLVVQSGEVHATTWTPETPLERGRALAWRVRAVMPTKRATPPALQESPAWFEVITASAADALVADLARCGESRIARAFVLASAGLLDDAVPLFEDVAAENPGAAVVHRWLHDLRARRGR